MTDQLVRQDHCGISRAHAQTAQDRRTFTRPTRRGGQSRIVTVPFVRVIRERDGDGWLTVTAKGHGWLHSSRQSALADKRWLDAQWRRRE